MVKKVRHLVGMRIASDFQTLTDMGLRNCLKEYAEIVKNR